MSQRYNQIEEFYTSSTNGKTPRTEEEKKRLGFWGQLKQAIKNWFPARRQFLFLPQVLSGRERYLVALALLVCLGGLIFLPFGLYYRNTIAAPDYGGSYTEALLGEPQFINPLLTQSSDTDRDLTELIYAGLMKYDGRGNLIPDLAEGYEISSDGLEYLFTLRSNLRWHDNLPLTTDDVVFTIRVLQANEYNSSQRINWNGVEVEKVTEQKVKFKLKNRYAQFMNNTTLGILPKHLWESVTATNFAKVDLNLKPIGAGPFRFKRLKKDDTGKIVNFELESFANYHGSRPYIDKLVFNFYNNEEALIEAYNSNAVDGIGFLSADNYDELHFTGKLSPQSIRMPRYFAAFFNQTSSPILGDKNIRLALNYGTNKQAIVDQVLAGQGMPINSPILAELNNPGSPKYIYDQNFATQILENSGWKDSNGDGFREKNGAPLRLNIKTSAWPELAQTAQLLKQQWEKLGFQVNVEIVKAENVSEIKQAIKDRAYEILIFGEILNLDQDQYTFWHSSQKKDLGLNLALYDNKNADKILEEARQTMNPLERAGQYADFEKLLLEDAPGVFLYSPYYLYLPSDNVKGNKMEVLALPSARFDGVDRWYINTKRVKQTE